MIAVELAHLAGGSPARVAMTRMTQVGMGNGFEAARRIESRGNFVADGLVVDEAVLTGRSDRVLVEALGVQFATLEPGDFGRDQGILVNEGVGTGICPFPQLAQVPVQRVQALGMALAGRPSCAARPPSMRDSNSSSMIE